MEVQNFLNRWAEPFQALRNKLFAKVYLAQTISLLGDAFTWVGLALLAYQFGSRMLPKGQHCYLKINVSSLPQFIQRGNPITYKL